MSYKVERWRGYEPWGVTNPWVFANYGQPQRHRGYISPMVYQTQPPSLRNDHLGQSDFVEEDRRRARRMEYVAVASLALSAWSMWFFYTKMSGPTRNGRARRNGRRRRPRRNSRGSKSLAAQVVDRLMLSRQHPAPFELVNEFGITVKQANAIRDLTGPGFGPGGKGYAWVVKQAERILKAPRKNSGESRLARSDWATGAHFPSFKTRAEAEAWARKKITDQPWKVFPHVQWGGSHDRTLWKAYVLRNS